MKSKLLTLALGLTVGMSAFAGPVISLPANPLYLKFNGNEQIAINGATTYAADPTKEEINWGVFTMSTMERGAIEVPNSTVAGTGGIFFVNGLTHNAQVTGMFYGVKGLPPGTSGNPFPAAAGYMDLYWRDLDTMSFTDNSAATPGVRTAFDKATGYTEGTFLARINFASGIIATDPNITIAGSVFPTEQGFAAGVATSFANIDTSVVGAWTQQLDTNYFNTAFGARDIRFRNNYESKISWGDGGNILGARLDDPAQAVAVPEPGVLALMGLAMLGMGVVRRRRND